MREIQYTKDILNASIRFRYEDLRLEIPEMEWEDITRFNNEGQIKDIIIQLLFHKNGAEVPEEFRGTEGKTIFREIHKNDKGDNHRRTASEVAYKRKQVEAEFKQQQAEAQKRYSQQHPDDEQFEEWVREAFKHDDAADASSYGNWWDKAHKPKPEKPEDTTMANKFLPFIVDKSTPDHVYRTLLSRSKGMNINLVTSIFWMVMDKGVAELRDFVKTLPESISVTQMYEEMVGKYSQFQIFDEDLSIFTDMAGHFTAEDWQQFDPDLIKELDPKDILAFIFVMFKTNQIENWTNFEFMVMLDSADDVLANITEYVPFADDGEAKEFYSNNDLRAYILYQALVRFSDGSKPSDPIKVVFVEEKANDASF